MTDMPPTRFRVVERGRRLEVIDTQAGKVPAPRVGKRAPHRLHLDQRGGEGRAVPRAYPRAGRRPALCAGQYHLRRHGGVGRAAVQAVWLRTGLLLVRHGDDRYLADRVSADARHPQEQSDHRGLILNHPVRQAPATRSGRGFPPWPDPHARYG